MKQLLHMSLSLGLMLLLVLTTFAGASPGGPSPVGTAAPTVTMYFFWGEGCSHCARAKPFVEELRRKYPSLRVESWEVLEHRENIPRLMEMAKVRNRTATGVPTFFIGEHMFSGFSEETAAGLEAAVRSAVEQKAPAAKAPPVKPPPAKPPPATAPAAKAPPAGAPETVKLPFLGRIDSSTLSLPVFTIVIAALDSFNPCAFFVLFFLLSLLIHAHSRPRMLMIGGIFVLASGVFYFVFMAAWLNLFLLVGSLPAITIAAGIVALLVAAINIKDFFFFEQGVSLVIPEGQKPKLFARMRRLLRADSLLSMLAGSTVLALAANSYELLCTAGFPMVFTRVLTLRRQESWQHYGYLLLYNLVYIIPLAVVVAVFTLTLGSRKLTENQGRVLKLVSGLMMLGLGLILLVNPALLNSPLASVALLAATLVVAALMVWAVRKAPPLGRPR